MLGCVEIVAEVCARAIIQDKPAEPHVFFCCSKALAWGALNMPAVYSTLEKALALVIENPSMLIDYDLDVFAAFVDQPAYAEWKTAKENETARLVRPLTSGAAPADSDDGPTLELADDSDGEESDDESDEPVGAGGASATGGELAGADGAGDESDEPAGADAAGAASAPAGTAAHATRKGNHRIAPSLAGRACRARVWGGGWW